MLSWLLSVQVLNQVKRIMANVKHKKIRYAQSIRLGNGTKKIVAVFQDGTTYSEIVK